MRRFFTWLCIFTVLCCLSDPNASYAKLLGGITNGHEPEYQTEESTNQYYINCISEVENASVFTQPDVTKPLKIPNGELGDYQFAKGTDLSSVTLVEVKGKQFLAGKVIHYAAGGTVHSWEKELKDIAPGEDSDTLYVLPKEWDCRLYQGDRRAEDCSIWKDACIEAVKESEKKCEK